MRLRFSYILAGTIVLCAGLWMASGEIIVSGAGEAEGALPIAGRDSQAPLFRVRVMEARNDLFAPTLTVSGRTEAEAKVTVQAETAARIVERPVSEGDTVRAGAPLCILDPGVREVRIKEAEARFDQAKFDYDAALKLRTSGFAAEARVSALQAALDSAEAGLRAARLELERTVLRAPVDGIVQSPLAETGALLPVGGTCAVIVAVDPMRAVGQVSEREIGQVALGDRVGIALVDGRKREGVIDFIASSADLATRTFRIEAVFDNKGGAVLDGMTASMTIRFDGARQETALVPASALVLNDDGAIGVRLVGAGNLVAFRPVGILDSAPEGFHVSGLEDGMQIITVGQEYVLAGQKVEPVSASGAGAEDAPEGAGAEDAPEGAGAGDAQGSGNAPAATQADDAQTDDVLAGDMQMADAGRENAP